MADVRMPDGTVIRNIPEGITQTELLRRYRQSERFRRPSIGPATPGARRAEGEVTLSGEVGSPSPIGLTGLDSEKSAQMRSALPLLTGMVASAGTGGIVAPALQFGGGSMIGDIAKNLFPGPTRPDVGPRGVLTSALRTGKNATRDALAGGLIFRSIQPAGQMLFGRSAPTFRGGNVARPSQSELSKEEAERFAREGLARLRDAAAREGVSHRQLAREIGAPRLPLDSITEGNILSATRTLLPGTRASNTRAFQAAKFINEQLKGFEGRAPNAASVAGKVRALASTVDDLAGFRRFSRIDDSARWIDEAVSTGNLESINALSEISPELHQQLLSKFMQQTISRFTRSSERFGRVLDGAAFRQWFVNNGDEVAKLYGDDVASNLDNFTNYAQFLDDSVAKAEAGIGALPGLARAVAEGAGSLTPLFGQAQPLVWAGEASSWILGHTLMNPSTASFQFFAALPKAGPAVQLGITAESSRREVGAPAERKAMEVVREALNFQ